MRAKEARKLAYDTNTNETNSQYSKIIDKITLRAQKGDYNMMWYESFNADVREKLVNNGYTVGGTSYDQRDGSTTKISW